MTTEITNPSCRYGHGRLIFHSPASGAVGFLLPAYAATPDYDTAPVQVHDTGYTISIYVCPTCGYLELFDDVFAGVTHG